MIKIGNISINPDALRGISFDEFSAMFAGKLKGVCLKEAFKRVIHETQKYSGDQLLEDKREKTERHHKYKKKKPLN